MVFNWEVYLKVTGWASSYQSVDRLLRYLRNRKIGSEGSRRNFGRVVYDFCSHVGKTPDDLITLKKNEIEKLAEEYCYHKREAGCSPRTVNAMMSNLKSFFRVNGFKGVEEIELQSYYIPARSRVRNEYVPTLEEARKMVNAAGSLRNRALILFMLSTGLRNSTLRAVLYGEIKQELEQGKSNIHVKVHADMKKVVFSACKGNIEYSVFTSQETSEALRLYIEERRRRFSVVNDDEVLFCSEFNQLARNQRPLKPLTGREVQIAIKEAARNAGLKDWKSVTPHCLRKTFESVLRSRLNDGSRLDVKTQEYFMGHILPGSQDTYYDKTKIEELRKEYAKLIFKPSEQGNFGALESLRAVAEALDIDCSKLLDSKKRELGRDLDSQEQVSLLKEAVKRLTCQSKGGNATEAKPANNAESNAPNQDKDNLFGTEAQTSSDDVNPKIRNTPEEIRGDEPTPPNSGNHINGSEANGVHINNVGMSKYGVHPATFNRGNTLPGENMLKQLNALVPESLYVSAKCGAINLGLKLQVWVSAAVRAFLFLQEHLESQETAQLDQNYAIFLLMAARNNLYKQGYAVADLNTEIRKAAQFLKSGGHDYQD
jgi:integrase